MTNLFADDDSIATEEIEALVVSILRHEGQPWPADIIDKVFLAIERDPHLLKRYQLFARDDLATTNRWVGRQVKEHTGLKVKGTCTTPKSRLIQTYSMLGR